LPGDVASEQDRFSFLRCLSPHFFSQFSEDESEELFCESLTLATSSASVAIKVSDKA
jgi:hypothetical protein